MKDFKEQIAKTRPVALYAHLTLDDFICVREVLLVDYDKHFSPLPAGERREIPLEGWVRITEPVEMAFSAIDNEEIVRNAVASLDEEEQKLRSELGKKLAALQDRKNQLLSLTYQPDVVP